MDSKGTSQLTTWRHLRRRFAERNAHHYEATTFAEIRCFLRAAFRRGWIKEALVDKVTTVRAVYEQKEPYTDEEVTAILDQAAKLDGGTHGYAKQPGTFRLLLELMLATGLRGRRCCEVLSASADKR